MFLPLSKIESRKRIVPCHSRKSRVEREMGTIKFSISREISLSTLDFSLESETLVNACHWVPTLENKLPKDIDNHDGVKGMGWY